MGGYRLTQILKPEGVVVSTALDSFIPFVDFFVVFYIAYYLFLLIPVIVYWKGYRDYWKMMLSFLAAILISLAVYAGFQTEVVRPGVEGTGLFSQLVLGVYQADRPVNALPSLHVSLTLLAVLFVFGRSRRLGLAILPLATLNVLSTLFIKQHAVLDVLAGAGLGAVVFRYRDAFKLGREV